MNYIIPLGNIILYFEINGYHLLSYTFLVYMYLPYSIHLFYFCFLLLLLFSLLYPSQYIGGIFSLRVYFYLITVMLYIVMLLQFIIYLQLTLFTYSLFDLDHSFFFCYFILKQQYFIQILILHQFSYIKLLMHYKNNIYSFCIVFLNIVYFKFKFQVKALILTTSSFYV